MATPRVSRASNVGLPPSAQRPTRVVLNVGDEVTLPEGQRGVLRYLGKINGKQGEYAGVELHEGYPGGKHSGEYDGVQYFRTARPNSGLFITYSKLIGSTTRPRNTSSANLNPPSAASLQTPGGSSRLSLIGKPNLAAPSPMYGKKVVPATPDRAVKPTTAASTTRKRLSLAGAGATSAAGPGSARVTASARASRQSGLFSVDENSPTKRVSTVNNSAGAVKSATSTSTATRVHRVTGSTGSAGSSASAEELAALSRELREARSQITEKDQQLEQQGELLREFERSLEEFQSLADGTSRGPFGDDAARIIEEKDQRIQHLRQELESKRREFRLSIDNLQEEMQEMSTMYESEIRNFKSSVGQAEEINQRIVELERMVEELEAGLKSSQINEQNARAQLSRLADIENKLLDREQELLETRESLDHCRKLLNDAGSDGGASDALRQELEEERAARSNLAEKLDKIQEELDQERSARVNLESKLEMQNSSSNADEQVARLEEELRTERDARASLESKLSSGDNDKLVDQLREQLEAEQRARTESESQLADGHETALKKLREQIEREISSKKELEKTLETLKSESADAQNLKKTLEQEKVSRQALERQMASLQSSRAVADEQRTLYENEQHKVLELEEQLANLKLELQAKPAPSTDVADLKEELEESRAAQKELEKELENLESMLEAKILREDELEKELEHARSAQQPQQRAASTSTADSDSKPVTPTAYKAQMVSINNPSQPPTMIPSPQKVDPAAGRELWCGLCEREGHESLDCPFEDEEF